MDVLTHGFLPYAVARLMRRPRAQAVAAALGGLAPDLDVLWAWTSGAHVSLYPLEHRGFTHTLLGAPLVALLVLFLLSRPVLARRWPRLGILEFHRGVFLPLLLGAWSHVLLDSLTITGTPALWPLSDARFTTGWYFYTVLPMLFVSAYLWWRVLRRRLGNRGLAAGTAVLISILIVSGSLRWASWPDDLAGDEAVTPTSLDWAWIVSRRNETGVTVYRTSWGVAEESLHFQEPNRTAASPAIAACEATSAYAGWAGQAWGLAVANATRTPEGGWRIHFLDAARLFEDRQGSGLAALFGHEEEHPLRCTVHSDGAVDARRPSGFWG